MAEDRSSTSVQVLCKSLNFLGSLSSSVKFRTVVCPVAPNQVRRLLDSQTTANNFFFFLMNDGSLKLTWADSLWNLSFTLVVH